MNTTSVKKTVYLTACLGVFLLVSGCVTSGMVTPSGFLADYSFMTSNSDADGYTNDLHIDIDSNADFKKYSNILIAPVILYFHEQSKGQGIDPVKLKELTDLLYDELKLVFEDDYAIVDTPGENTILIRTAITDVVPNKPIFNVHWTTTLAGIGLGGAAIETELVDAVTGKRLIAVVENKKGKRQKYFKGWKKWGHTEDVMSQWALMLKEKLDEQKE